MIELHIFETDGVSTKKRCINRVNENPKEKLETEFNDRLHSSRPTADVNEDKVKQDDVLITDDRRITVAKLCKNFQVSHDST